MSAVAELDAGLQAMLGLKPPGVSGSRIQAITQLCVNNVQSESVLIQKLFTHFKKTPGTHKLGVLYVVDSVTRKWMEQAKAQGQPIAKGAPDGTFAAGVLRVTELMPTLMNDIIATAPEDQKEKIRKLIDIWDKGQTFAPSMVNSFKEKLNAPRPQNESTTPPGSPPAHLRASFGPGSSRPAAPPAQPPAMPNIMEQLANIARLNATAAQSNPSLAAPTPAPAPAPAQVMAPTPVPAAAPVFGASAPPSNGAPQPVPVHGQGLPGMPFLPTSQPAAQPVNMPSGLPFAYPPPAQPAPVNAASNPAGNPAVVQLAATLLAQGFEVDKIASIIQLMSQAGTLPGAAPLPQQMAHQPPPAGYAVPPPVGGPPAGPAPWEQQGRPDDSRDRNGYHDDLRSPNRPRGRSRSRSPHRWDGRGSPRSRGGAFDYGRNSPPGGRGRPGPDDRDRDRGGRGRMTDYRQRSPPARRGSPDREPFPQEKWVEYDKTLPNGCIRVYSRTLFVGGVTCSEADLRQIFSRFGSVQTCIVNKEKRHAFVKMYFRKDAEAAKTAMEDPRNQGNQDLQLRTRWGVGFGPRDCSDYQSGVSVIPIQKLTEADRKWMLTAPYGGSGGRPIESGMCVEEPDIEIGAGVSSKAISRRMQTDKGGNHGPKSSRKEDDPGHHGGGGGGGGGGGSQGGGGGGRWRHGRDKHRGSGSNNGGGGGDNRRGGDDRHSNRGSGGGGHGGGNSGMNGNNDEPVVLGLPGNITVGPNGINYPPNFAFGAPTEAGMS